MVTNNSCDYSPTQYSLQTGGANGSLTQLATGTAGQLLVSGGSSANPSWSNPAAVGSSLLLIDSVALGGQTSVVISGLPATFQAYLLSISGLIFTGSPSDDYQLDFSNNNGSSYASSGMSNGINYNAYNSASPNNSNSASTGPLSVSADDTTTYNASIWLTNINTLFPCTYFGQAFYGSNFSYATVFGSTGTYTGVNAIRISSTSGLSLYTGQISLYGVEG